MAEEGAAAGVSGREAMVENPDDIFVEIQARDAFSGSILRQQTPMSRPNDSGFLMDAGGSPRASQRSYNSRSRYPGPNFSQAPMPLPQRLQLYKDIIHDVIHGDLAGLRQKLKANRITEVVHIRGVNNFVSDLTCYEEEEIETAMWNPLHFAVYHQHLPIVKYLVSELRVNISITAPKAHGESEKDPTNSVNFPEDKFMLLLIAFAKRDRPMLEFLLDELWYFWSITFVEHLFNSISSHDESSGQDPWIEVIPIVLRSRTLHTYFQNLTFKKRQQWLSKFILDVTTGNNVDRGSRLYE